MDAGRPTKFKREYHKQILDLFKEGCSISEIALTLDINRSTIYYWRDNNIDGFSTTYKKGIEYSQGWWEKQGRDGQWASNDPMARKLNPAIWFMNMKNRFREDWADKPQQVESEVKSEVFEMLDKAYEDE